MRAAIICLVVGVASVAAADPSHVRMSATQAEIDDESAAPVRLPLQVDTGWRLVSAEVIDAAINGRRDKDVLEAFSKVSTVGGVAVELFIRRDGLRWPGAYQVILQLTIEEVPKLAPAPGAGSAAVPAAGSAAGSAAPPPAPPQPLQRIDERATITVNKVGPKLDNPSPVAIRVTSAFFQDYRTVTPLLLDETSNRGRLTRVIITQRGPTLHDSAPTDTRVVFKLDPDTVDPGGQRALVAQLVGDPPWGTSSGTLEINAQQLDKPVTVAFTIEHRRWSGYIALLFALGGVAGYVIRTWAKRVTDRLKLQQDASNARIALLALDERSLPAEHKQLADAVAALELAIAREDDAALQAAIDVATPLLATVTATHTTQLAERRALLVRYAAVPDLLLTAEIGVDLAGYPEAIAAVDDALLEHDVLRADRGLTQLAARLAGRRDALKAWTERLASALDGIASAITTAPTALRTQWSKVTGDPIRIAAKKKLMLETCEAAEPEVSELEGRVYHSRHELARLAGAATTRLGNAPQLAAELAEAARFRDGDLPAAMAQLATTAAAWSAILQRVLEPMRSSSNAAIAAAAESAMTARNAGDYETAFDKLNTLLEKPQGGTAVAVPAVAPPAAAERTSAAVPVSASVPAVLDGALVSPTLRRTGVWIKVLQVAAAYCVLPFGAWLAYHEGFIGRLPELIAIAATGFITDFTADAAVAKLERLKK